MPFPSVDAAPAPPGKAAPTAGQQRIAALDVTRGIALFGILLMNITFMSAPEATFFNPAYSLGDPTVNFVLWFGMFTFFEGTMRALFSLLFGAGAMLLLLRMEERGSGLGLFGRLERIEIYLVVLAGWAFEIALSLIWLRHYRFGPFEWLWRSFTYLCWQPMRRDRPLPEAGPQGQ